MAHYHAFERLEYLAEHPECEICGIIKKFHDEGEGQVHQDVKWWPVCSIKSEEIHHKAGRDGLLLLAKEHFMASCTSKTHRNGHTWIKEHPAAAKLLELTITRLGRLCR